MNNYGLTTVSEFLEDWIVYRNLAPVDPRLPAFTSFYRQLDLPDYQLPRKNEPAYAKAIVYLLSQARQLGNPTTSIKRLVFLGDTQLLDATAFENICQVGDWPGVAFIGAETIEPPTVNIKNLGSQARLYLANRWSALPDFDSYLGSQAFPVDEATAIVIDLDKTAIGARGRNGHMIDLARTQAVEGTVASLLRESFNKPAFLQAYNLLNQPEFHPFTADNQDYLAYICLILGSGLEGLDELVKEVRRERGTSFRQFIERVDQQAGQLPPGLAEIHHAIYQNVLAGDPTPFKEFRRIEYRITIGRMGFLDDHTSVHELLANEIVITQEVRQVALAWKKRGALVFGLSDKPDEASIPPPSLSSQGYLPIHRSPTHAIGV